MTDANIRVAVGEELRLAQIAMRAAEALLDLGLAPDAASRMYYGALHAALSVAAAASRAPISSFIPLVTACAATLIAFLIARDVDVPCEMMLTPFTPRSGAPPYSE